LIVDVHTHVPTYRDSVPPGSEVWNKVFRPDKAVRVTYTFQDYLEAMKPVDRAIVFGIAPSPYRDGTHALGDTEYNVNVNDQTAALVALAPHKLIGFMSVHPDDASVMDEIERCVCDLKLRGIKLGPNYQYFDPLGPAARRVYGRAQELGLPILFHQGTSGVRDAPLRYAHPLVMDEIATAFPELRIVMAHMGHPWHADTISVVRKHPNVYADVSAQFYRPWSFYNGFRLAWEWGITHKLLFATDYPITTPEETLHHLRHFNEFARRHHLPEVPDEVFEGIIHRESLKLLGLE